jgi:hypothetical protein
LILIRLALYRGNPVNRIDPPGLFIDTILDIGFIPYDIYALATGGRQDLGTNLASPGADIDGLLIPGVTGAGAVVRSGKAAKKAVDASEVLLRSSRQLHAKFKHAKDFGVVGTYSKANAAKFSEAIHKHINSQGVSKIQGTYHKQPVTHYLDPSSGLNVIADSTGNFIRGWKLSPAQLQNVLTHGGL